MKTESIHPIKILFGIPISPDKIVERFVYSYVLEGEKICLIDTGVTGAEKDISIALQKCSKNLSDVDIIILTHSHPDHIGAASLIQHKSGAQVYAHTNERAWIEDVDRQGKERPVPGFAKLVAGSVALDRLLVDGDVLSFGEGLTFRVLHTPGHSSGSISLLSEENGILFSGDHILGHITPNALPMMEKDTLLPIRQSQKEYFNSLDTVARLDPKIIYPAHGTEIRDFHAIHPIYRECFDRRQKDILSIIQRKSAQSIYAIARELFPEIKGRAFVLNLFLALSETYTHLQVLESEGLARMVETDGILRIGVI